MKVDVMEYMNMNIESIPNGSPVTYNASPKISDDHNHELDNGPQQPKVNGPLTTKDSVTIAKQDITEFVLDKATNLMINIVRDKFTKEIIRQIPSEEYVKLKQLMKEVVSPFLVSEA